MARPKLGIVSLIWLLAPFILGLASNGESKDEAAVPTLREYESPLDDSAATFLKSEIVNGLTFTSKLCKISGFYCQATGDSDEASLETSIRQVSGRNGWRWVAAAKDSEDNKDGAASIRQVSGRNGWRWVAANKPQDDEAITASIRQVSGRNGWRRIAADEKPENTKDLTTSIRQVSGRNGWRWIAASEKPENTEDLSTSIRQVSGRNGWRWIAANEKPENTEDLTTSIRQVSGRNGWRWIAANENEDLATSIRQISGRNGWRWVAANEKPENTEDLSASIRQISGRNGWRWIAASEKPENTEDLTTSIRQVSGRNGWRWIAASKPQDAEALTTSIHQVAATSDETSHKGHHHHTGKDDGMMFRMTILQKSGSVLLPPLYDRAPNKFLHPLLQDTLPFTSAALPKLMSTFQVYPDSQYGRIMTSMVEGCETLGKKDISSMSLKEQVDIGKCALTPKDVHGIASSLLKDEVAACSNCGLQVIPATYSSKVPEMVTVESFEVVANSTAVLHPVPFPYTVYNCHKIYDTKVVKVTLKTPAGESSVVAPAICHMNTSQFRPTHPAFAELNMKPGQGEICHWLLERTIVWYV